MDTKEQDFQNRLVALLADLHNWGNKDPEVMWLLGRLGASMLGDADKASWIEVKAGLTPEARASLLATIQSQGNSLHQRDQRRAAYALNVLAVSIVADTMPVAAITEGAALVDEVIEAAIRAYRKSTGGGKSLRPGRRGPQ